MDLNNTTSQKIIIYQTDDGAVEIKHYCVYEESPGVFAIEDYVIN